MIRQQLPADIVMTVRTGAQTGLRRQTSRGDCLPPNHQTVLLYRKNLPQPSVMKSHAIRCVTDSTCGWSGASLVAPHTCRRRSTPTIYLL